MGACLSNFEVECLSPSFYFRTDALKDSRRVWQNNAQLTHPPQRPARGQVGAAAAAVEEGGGGGGAGGGGGGGPQLETLTSLAS